MRNRSQPVQVARKCFEFGRIAVTQRVMVATVHQHGTCDSGGINQPFESAPKKTAEKRTKRAHVPGRTRWRGRPREKLPSVGDVEKAAPLACEANAT
jgi:hypothetical protein